ncbi:hypothetical protein SDJN03_11054, partial [Cucurbita argyrosperma subsp. sororia]
MVDKEIKEDEDILLRFIESAMESGPEFKKEQDDLRLANKEGEFKKEQDDLSLANKGEFKKEQDDLSLANKGEFKKEQDDLSLANKEGDGGFKAETGEENHKVLNDHISYSSCDIKEDEDIILRLHESFMDSVCESVHAADLARQQILADKESSGGFKHKIEEEKQEDLHEDASQSLNAIEKDEDMILRLNRLFLEAVRQFLADRERPDGLKTETEEHLRADSPHSRYIKKNEDIILRLDDLFMESVREFKTKQDRRSLADEKSHGRFKHQNREESHGGFEHQNREESHGGFKHQNREEIHGGFKHQNREESHGGFEHQNREEIHGGFEHQIREENRYAFSRNEDIILELFIESIRQPVNAFDLSKQEQNDKPLYGHHDLQRDKESHGGFEQKVKEATREDLLGYASHSQYHDYDIILQFNKLAMESDRRYVASKLQREQKDEENDGRSKYKTEEDETPPIKKNLEESNTSETFKIKECPKVKTENDNPFDMPLKPLEELEEIVLKLYKFMDYTSSILKDIQRVKYKEQDKYHFLDNVRLLFLSSSRKVNVVIDELKLLKDKEIGEEKSPPTNALSPEIALFQAVEINAKLVNRSFIHTVAFLYDDKCREKEISCCIAEMNRTMENLRVVLLRARPRKWLLSRSLRI